MHEMMWFYFVLVLYITQLHCTSYITLRYNHNCNYNYNCPYTSLRYTRHYTPLLTLQHATNTTTTTLHYTKLHCTSYTTLHYNHNCNYNYNCPYTTTTLITLCYNYSSNTVEYFTLDYTTLYHTTVHNATVHYATLRLITPHHSYNCQLRYTN